MYHEQSKIQIQKAGLGQYVWPVWRSGFAIGATGGASGAHGSENCTWWVTHIFAPAVGELLWDR